MVAALAVACFFVTLLAKGDSLSCIECSNISGTSCTGPSKLCASSTDTCITSIVETVLGAQTASVVARGCGKSSDCSKITTLSTKEMSVKSNTSCCASDGCTSAVPPLPSTSSTPNGVTCRSCLTQSSSSCYTSETMACNGEEKKCIRYAVLTKGPVSTNMAVRGCATQSFCDIGSSSTTSEGVTVTIDIACTDSSIRLEHGVFLPAVSAILLLKAVF